MTINCSLRSNIPVKIGIYEHRRQVAYIGKDMITAKHHPWAEVLFSKYITGLVKRHFHSLELIGGLPSLDSRYPLLIIPNHSTWWDGFFVCLLNSERLKRTLFMMMLDEQLARFRFFSLVGAYGIRPGERKAVLESLRYTAELLDCPQNAVCIYPQGEFRRFESRPLGFGRGVDSVLKIHGGPVTVVPLGIRCELLQEQRPDAFLMMGEPRIFSSDNFPGISWLEDQEQELLDRLTDSIAKGDRGEQLVKGRGSANSR